MTDAPLTPAADAAPGEADAEDETSTRLPRVVVRMSRPMKEALDKYCTDNDVLATSLGRTLLAKEIGWDLASDPEAPGSATRTRYADDSAREEGKERNRLYRTLLRKALYQAHQATMKKRPLLATAATDTVRALSVDDAKTKATLAQLKALDATLEEAMKAGA